MEARGRTLQREGRKKSCLRNSIQPESKKVWEFLGKSSSRGKEPDGNGSSRGGTM